MFYDDDDDRLSYAWLIGNGIIVVLAYFSLKSASIICGNEWASCSGNVSKTRRDERLSWPGLLTYSGLPT